MHKKTNAGTASRLQVTMRSLPGRSNLVRSLRSIDLQMNAFVKKVEDLPIDKSCFREYLMCSVPVFDPED